MSSRKSKGLNERIYLLNANFEDNIWKLTIKGSSKRIYNITLSNDNVKCGCMDFAIRKKVCKHMHFLLGRVITINNINEISDITSKFDDITKQLTDKLINYEIKDEKQDYDNTDYCSICFEEFGSENVQQCKVTCKNFFHTECINIWLSKNNNCPLCRSPWFDTKSNDLFEEFSGLTLGNQLS